MVDNDKDEVIFVTKEWVRDNLGISLAEQERKRSESDGTFPGLYVMGDDPWDPQARVAYYKSAMLQWAFSRPARPLKVLHPDRSRIVGKKKQKCLPAPPLKLTDGSEPD